MAGLSGVMTGTRTALSLWLLRLVKPCTKLLSMSYDECWIVLISMLEVDVGWYLGTVSGTCKEGWVG